MGDLQSVLQRIGLDVPWLPDETLYSWCSRYHRLAVNGLSGRTSLQLFGSRHQGLAHDLPASLAQFVLRTSGSLGDVQEIIRDRTVLPFYLPFKSHDLSLRASALMAAEGIGSLKFQLGLLTSGLGAAHPLKACPACMQADRHDHTLAYWRRSHQLPGVWICPTHGRPLQHSPVKLDQRARFQWVLPAKSGLVSLPVSELTSDAATDAWQRMAGFSLSLAREPGARLADPARIRCALRHALLRRGWLSAGGRVRWAELMHSLDAHAQSLSMMPPLAGHINLQNCRSLLSTVLQARTLTHPLRYLMLIAWLFQDWESFLAAYDHDGDSEISAGAPIQPRVGVRDSGPVQDAIEALTLGRESPTAIARRLGVTPSTVAAWGARVGIQTPRRPKSIHDEVWRQAVGMLECAADKSEVARSCAISEVSVTRILRCVPGLQDKWHLVRREKAQEHARSAWLAIIAAQAWLGVGGLRRLQPSIYAWLYRNDREWLRQQCANVIRVPGGNNAGSRMRLADERYGATLQKMWRSSERPQFGAQATLRMLLLHAPGLKKILKNPDRWPITMGVVREMTQADRSIPSKGDGLPL